ncbi:MAG TPA: hypothetical protein VLE89_06345 [Chlamydiales bacterium]|nr:hypothetical protein [Chlamydiales bacterium]
MRNRIKINFDLKKKAFKISLPIFSSREELPGNIVQYVEARKSHTFKPHTTFFTLEEGKVHLIQEIPFQWGFQPTFRHQVYHFWQMSKRLHRMFSEMNTEQNIQDALYLDSDFQE